MSKIGFTIREPSIHRFNVDVRVDNDGIFYCNLDETTAKLFADNGIELGWNNRTKQACQFTCDTLKGLKEKIQAKIDEMSSVEEMMRETVIRWNISTCCSYCMTEKGDFVPNGYWLPRKSNGDVWHTGTVESNACNTRPMGLQIYAYPEIKITYKYKTSGRILIKREKINDDFEGESNDPVQWLAGLCGQRPPSDQTHLETKLHEMPATPENAQFFVNLYKGLFALNEKIKPFITNSDTIQKLIAGGGRLLSPGKEQ